MMHLSLDSVQSVALRLEASSWNYHFWDLGFEGIRPRSGFKASGCGWTQMMSGG